MDIPDISKINIDKIQLPFFDEKEIEMDMLRLDKIHPVISGNKWFKMKYYLEKFHSGNYNGIITFGGAWSNHIVAVACACYRQKIKCIGIIRGERPTVLSTTLQEAVKYKMELKFISRKLYREKSNDEFLQKLKEDYPGFYIIPEGGAGDDGEKGAGEILELVDKNKYTHIACAVGTATMFRGIVKKSAANQQIIGIPVLKGFKEIKEPPFIKIFPAYHFGGYAKYNETLTGFMNDFYRHTNIPTDFVYTGKLVYGIYDLVNENYFPQKSNILLIHSGGLQGNLSLPKGTLIF